MSRSTPPCYTMRPVGRVQGCPQRTLLITAMTQDHILCARTDTLAGTKAELAISAESRAYYRQGCTGICFSHTTKRPEPPRVPDILRFTVHGRMPSHRVRAAGCDMLVFTKTLDTLAETSNHGKDIYSMFLTEVCGLSKGFRICTYLLRHLALGADLGGRPTSPDALLRRPRRRSPI
jgi:hypothetical protein